MPLQETTGAASYDAYGGGPAGPFNYIEDVFSTYLYTGNGSTQTITNGIDLSGKGGLTWIKRRNGSGTEPHVLVDTLRGSGKYIASNTADAQIDNSAFWTYVFGSNGWSITASGSEVNNGAGIYASWTFREQPKFFDVVTYTGNGSNRTIAHSLGSVPGCIIVKRTDTTADWQVYHRSNANTEYIVLNSTAAKATGTTRWNSTTPTSTEFSLGTDTTVNASGGTYVAYLFAHDAGGFGASGTDNVISCGSYTGNGSSTGPTITLGYEPQWVMIKAASAGSQWHMYDTMRSWTDGGVDSILYANLSNAEDNTNSNLIRPLANGFQLTANYTANDNGVTYIYIAIRRGPMRTPTTGTSVFSPIAANNTQGTKNTTDFAIDTQMLRWRNGSSSTYVVDRLRGVSSTTTNSERYLQTNNDNIEVAGTSLTQYWDNTGFQTSSGNAGASNIYWSFRRAPGFFDVVCYTGTSTVPQTITHNLLSVPELIIIKRRTTGTGQEWVVYSSARGTGKWLSLNSTSSEFTGSLITATSTTTFSVEGNSAGVNANGAGYVAYLFATVAGVSKVGSYTGNGSSQTINCGFTGGARFVLIKRTDSTGDWYVWDSARGIVAGNDPHLSLNSTAAEVTTDDSVDTDSTGFVVNQVAATNVNVSSATYIFLAIA